MDAEGFFSFFEKSLRLWLPTLVSMKFRQANNCLRISINGAEDFVILAMAAASANIRCELDATFDEKLESRKSLGSCTIRLDLVAHCLDIRLVYVLYEVFGMAVLKAPLENGHDRDEWKEIHGWEEWISELRSQRSEYE